ncbi:MAG: hypothetical protein CVV23_06035 [Ignavibacteriae bacterium HGW-Ignavibacteriae-2]|jgi:PAS domain S-box-containing protein|nr:MAG: hypothetical protein CVV23_06035 [Ignavibacteriae bacterium HGW-Ignavibacteriae-2]
MQRNIENIILRKIAESFPEAIVVINSETDEILFLNDLFRQLWGIEKTSEYKLQVIDSLIKNKIDFTKSGIQSNDFSIKTLPEQMLYTLDSSSIEVQYSPLLSEYENIIIYKFNIVAGSRMFSEQYPSVFRQIYLMLNTIPIPIFFKDSGGRYTGCNTAFEKFMGLKRENILGKNADEILPEELASFYMEMDTVLLNNPGEIIKEGSLKISDGKVHDVIVHKATYYTQKGKIDGIIGLIFDITEQKKAQHVLKDSEAKLKEINDTKDKFFSILAHDLKNPFSVLLGITDFLIENFEDFSEEELLESLNRLNSSSKHLFRLFENLLEWSRLQRGSIRFEPKKLNLKTIVTISLYPLMITAAEKKIKIKNNIDDDFEIYADEKMLEATLRNLAANAIKYTNETGQIELNARLFDENTIEITVTDNGIGIGADLINNLFKIEKKISTPGTKNEQGTGLGLILCKEFVEKNGGTLKVESTLKKGSKFKFTVPTTFIN